MIQYKSIDQSQFAEGEDIEEQERRFDEFLKKTLLEIQPSQESFRLSLKGSSERTLSNKGNFSDKGNLSAEKRLSDERRLSDKENLSDEENLSDKGRLSSKEKPSSESKGISIPYIFLKTCNRSELYYGEGDVPDDVARHLFRVVSGLESAIVGERAVQGQVKEAYYSAKDQRALTAELHKLFQSALQVGKRVRNETEISHGAVSHSLAAIEILESFENLNLKNAHITIIGVNKLTADILKFLQNKGAKMVFLANRSQIKAHYLADPLGIQVYTLDEKKDFLAHTDILISATSAPHLIIHKEDIPKDKELLAIDLAFPHDIDSKLKELPHVHLYNIRDVEQKVRQNLDVREAEVKKAEIIIEEEIQEMKEALERRKKYIV